MTRKLIIGCLQSIIDIYEMSKNEKPWANVPIDSEDVEAIRLSIEKWGEQNAEHCDDAISRQAVMDFIRGLTRWGVRSEDGKFNNVGLLYDDVMFGLDRLPSVTPKQNWILVNERLPEDSYAVLVWCPERRNIYCANREKDQWCICGTYHIVSEDVDAWMPLPEPYKPESEG